MRSCLVAGLVTLSIGACAKQAPLSTETTGPVGIEKVSVSIAPGVPIVAGQGMDCGAVSRRVCLARQIRADLETALPPRRATDRPAELIIGVTAMHIEGAARQLLIGSGHKMAFMAQLVDAETRDIIATSDEMAVSAGYTPGGVVAVALDAVSRDPMVRLSEEVAEDVCYWLDMPCDP